MASQTKVANHVRAILKEFSIDVNKDGLSETPERVARMYSELLQGYTQDPAAVFKTFESGSYDGLVLVADIQFYSLCEHHMIPFHGKVHIGYLPNKKILGLSKFARLVNIFARRLQVQERLTEQIATTIMTNLKPHGVIVFIEAEHLCMSMRGVNKPGAVTKTLSAKGVCAKNQDYVSSFLNQLRLDKW